MSKGHKNYKHKSSKKKTETPNTSVMKTIPQFLFEISNHKNIPAYAETFKKLQEEGNPLAIALYKTGTHIKVNQKHSSCCDPLKLVFSMFEGERLSLPKYLKEEIYNAPTEKDAGKKAADLIIHCCPENAYTNALKNNLKIAYQKC